MIRPLTTARRGGRRRRTIGVTLAALAALAATSCSASGGASVVSVAPGKTAAPATAKGASTTVAPAAAAAATTAGATAPAPAPAAPAFDPASVLTQALDTLAPAYDLATTISNGPTLVQTITGRVVGPTSQLSIMRNNATLEYLQVPPKAWSRDPGGDWSALEGDVPSQSSLDALRQPTKASAVSEDATARTVHATYPSQAFGIPGGGTVEVDVVIGTDGAVSISYPVTVGDKPLSVVEKLVAAPDATPFAAP